MSGGALQQPAHGYKGGCSIQFGRTIVDGSVCSRQRTTHLHNQPIKNCCRLSTELLYHFIVLLNGFYG